jgi:hypothetical protein
MTDHQPERFAHLLEQLSAIEPRPGVVERALERTRKSLGAVPAVSDRIDSRRPRRRALWSSRWAAAAAVLTVLALALVRSLIFSDLGFQSAFARVQSALKAVPSISYRMEVLEAAPGTDVRPSKVMLDLSRKLARQETVDGDQVLISDLKSGRMIQLMPRQKLAIMMNGTQNHEPPSDFGNFVEKLRNADPKSAQHLPDGEWDGRQVDRYRIPTDSPLANGAEWLFFIDKQTQLPVRAEGILRLKGGRMLARLACTDFSYQECAASLFELAPPNDYRVQKLATPRSEPVAIAPRSGQAKPVDFQIRLAESTAGDGLTEAVVGKTDLKVYLHSEVVITRQDIQEARLLQHESSEYVIELTFTAKGAERMSEATSKNRNKHLAVLINGRVVFAPRIFATISSAAQIMGNFTAEEASDIVRGLRGSKE